MEKRVTLAKFFQFVVLEDQDCCTYQDPSADDVKLAKETSKKESKNGNLQSPEFNDDNNSANQ